MGNVGKLWQTMWRNDFVNLLLSLRELVCVKYHGKHHRQERPSRGRHASFIDSADSLSAFIVAQPEFLLILYERSLPAIWCISPFSYVLGHR